MVQGRERLYATMDLNWFGVNDFAVVLVVLVVADG